MGDVGVWWDGCRLRGPLKAHGRRGDGGYQGLVELSGVVAPVVGRWGSGDGSASSVPSVTPQLVLTFFFMYIKLLG